MADLSMLGGLNPVEPIDTADYPVAKRPAFQLPTKGVYQLQAPPSFPAEAFGRTQRTKALAISLEPTVIVGPTNAGFNIRKQKIYATTWKDKDTGKTVSGIGNYLVAHGVKATLNDEQALADAVESTAGQVYEAKVDWIAARGDFKVKGMENFPKNDDGTYQSWVTHPTELNEQGLPARVNAYLEITYFVPRS